MTDRVHRGVVAGRAFRWPACSEFAAASGAIFNATETHRYLLWRRWSDRPLVGFVLLNPSTADERRDDPTLRRCIGFARRWGAGGLLVGNIFALRSTDPSCLRAAADPVGPKNDEHLKGIAARASRLIVAWGNHGGLMERGRRVLELLTPLAPIECFGCTRLGHPRHPLYVRADRCTSPIGAVAVRA